MEVKAKSKSFHERTNLILPVRRIHSVLKSGYYARRISIEAAIFLTAVLEYLSMEILELAAKAAVEHRKKRITPRYVVLAVRNDDELNRMLKHVIISQGGVIPKIEPELRPKKTVIQKHILSDDSNNTSSQEY